MRLNITSPAEGRGKAVSWTAAQDAGGSAREADAVLHAGDPIARTLVEAARLGMRRERCRIRLEGGADALAELAWQAVRAYFHGAYRVSRAAVRARLAQETRGGEPAAACGGQGTLRARTTPAMGGRAEADGEGLFGGIDAFADFGGAELVLECGADVADAAQRGWLFALCESRARTLGNLPANLLGAKAMARYLSDMAAARGLGVRVLGDAELRALGCGGILAVNAACPREAKLVVLEYRPADCAQPPVGLVGKGVMFDAGGIHLKDIRSMEGMKFDMCGAASAAELVEYAAMTDGATPLIAVLPLVENAIGASATRMGDVIATLSGQTVEIYNADAEGRLVLCDALAYAQRLGARTVIDLATLTNGCHAALGDEVGGWFSNAEPLAARFAEAAQRAGEPMWRLPLMDCYREALTWTDCADVANYAPGQGAAASMAACFLERFIEPESAWVHVDMVGPAVRRGANALECAGARGYGMATIAMLLQANG